MIVVGVRDSNGCIPRPLAVAPDDNSNAHQQGALPPAPTEPDEWESMMRKRGADVEGDLETEQLITGVIFHIEEYFLAYLEVLIPTTINKTVFFK